MRHFAGLAVAVLGWTAAAVAQSVCLPAPRLLTTYPMGAQAGQTVDVTITGENLELLAGLRFSHPGITAEPKRDAAGQPLPNQFVVQVTPDCPAGLYEARLLTRLGLSSSRMFTIGTLAERTRSTPNTTLEKAETLPLDTVFNAFMSRQAIDYYVVELASGERVVIECAARGIDSKLTPVLILADAAGNDLQVERRGGTIDFTAAEAGRYVVKVHDLTFNGGPEYFYRLVARKAAPGESLARQPTTRAVSSFSWPPVGLADAAAVIETEEAASQSITLPCDLAGRFYPAADVDSFEFTARKGEVWWIEVGSERLGRPTDPALVVQRVDRTGNAEQLVDVLELSDIPSPVKVSSNGYAYDGPPYHAGSADINGKLEIPEDGTYRLQLTDLFGGTRSDPHNTYRLILRPAAPDFAVVGWPLHMELRNGDRNALSKPVALRGGATMPFEVVVIRRDGFDGPIDLVMEHLPPGVTATGLTIPAGKSRGILLITADQDAPRGVADATFVGRASINGETVTRPGRFAEMAWPVRDAWSEIPRPRLLATVPVSVSGHEFAPLTIAPADTKVWEAKAGETLKIPLVHTRRCEFSGANLSLKTFGHGFESNSAFGVPFAAESSEAVLDLAKLKVAPGDYTIAFYGSAVAKYRDFPEGVTLAEAAQQQAQQQLDELTAAARTAKEAAESATAEQKESLVKAASEAEARQKSAEAALKEADKKLKEATDRAKPKDIVDIIVSAPIQIRVLPTEEAAKK